MIEITILQTGDRAEAETPEAALLAARTMVGDYAAATGSTVSHFTARFSVDGEAITEVLVKSIVVRKENA